MKPSCSPCLADGFKHQVLTVDPGNDLEAVVDVEVWNQNPGKFLLYIGDYTTQLYIYRDYLKKPLFSECRRAKGFECCSTVFLLQRLIGNSSVAANGCQWKNVCFPFGVVCCFLVIFPGWNGGRIGGHVHQEFGEVGRSADPEAVWPSTVAVKNRSNSNCNSNTLQRMGQYCIVDNLFRYFWNYDVKSARCIHHIIQRQDDFLVGRRSVWPDICRGMYTVTSRQVQHFLSICTFQSR